MPGLTHNVSAERGSDCLDKWPHNCRIKLQTWRKLDQDLSELSAQSGNVSKKALQRPVDIAQATLMGDRLPHLDSKAEVLRDIGGPTLIGRQAVRAVERGVDLNTVAA